MSLRVGDVCSGIGGFAIATEAMGWTTEWFVEIDPNCRFWLGEHFPGIPIQHDLTQLDFSSLAPVDVPSSRSARSKGPSK